MFTESQLDQLRRDYAKIETVDPENKVYKMLVKYMDRLNQDQLVILASANIKFISPLARNRLTNR